MRYWVDTLGAWDRSGGVVPLWFLVFRAYSVGPARHAFVCARANWLKCAMWDTFPYGKEDY